MSWTGWIKFMFLFWGHTLQVKCYCIGSFKHLLLKNTSEKVAFFEANICPGQRPVRGPHVVLQTYKSVPPTIFLSS